MVAGSLNKPPAPGPSPRAPATPAAPTAVGGFGRASTRAARRRSRTPGSDRAALAAGLTGGPARAPGAGAGGARRRKCSRVARRPRRRHGGPFWWLRAQLCRRGFPCATPCGPPGCGPASARLAWMPAAPAQQHSPHGAVPHRRGHPKPASAEAWGSTVAAPAPRHLVARHSVAGGGAAGPGSPGEVAALPWAHPRPRFHSLVTRHPSLAGSLAGSRRLTHEGAVGPTARVPGAGRNRRALGHNAGGQGRGRRPACLRRRVQRRGPRRRLGRGRGGAHWCSVRCIPRLAGRRGGGRVLSLGLFGRL